MSSFPFSSPASHPVCDFFDIPSFITSSSSSVVSFCLNHPFSSFPCEECPVSPLPHQWDRTMGPIFSPGFSPPITVPARFFPMAEHKTSSRLLGTNPLHPGFSNGLEGAMRLAVYPFQLERSLSLFIPSSFCLKAESFGIFQSILSLFYHGLLPLACWQLSHISISLSFLTTGIFKFINLCDLIGGAVWYKSIRGGVQAFTGNKHDSQMHLQPFFHAHVKHVSYCQSHRSCVGTFKAK